MLTDAVDAPIRRIAFTSRDADEVTDYIGQTYVGNKTVFGVVHGPAGFTARDAEAGSIATARVWCSIDYRGWTEPWDFFCSFVLDHGVAHVTSAAGEVWLRPGDAMVYPLGVPLRFDMVDVGARVVRMPMTRLEQAAQTLDVPAAHLRLEGTRPVSAAMARFWNHQVGLVYRSLTEDASPMQGALLREELTRMTALAALHVFANTALSQPYTNGPGRVAPAVVRRAVAHIDAHADQPLTLNDIAVAAGTGARALEYAFRSHLDTTPLAYLRRVRLERAHRELQDADPVRGETVAAVATRWGFANTGRFAAEHRAAYGELPSHTLRT